jgi:glycosyltransferase involved in cell wall biosynthesis
MRENNQMIRRDNSQRTRIVGVMVTYNGEGFIAAQVESMLRQHLDLDAVVVVDDHSTDSTLEMVRDLLTPFPGSVDIHLSSQPRSRAVRTRIAQNFVQAVDAAKALGAEFAILADQDDEWLPGRVEEQVGFLTDHPDIDYLANDGNLIDEHGELLPGSIRTHFPMAESDGDHVRTLQRVLAAPAATGAASAIRLSRPGRWTVPEGWLHDRWWSLASAARGALYVSSRRVINYRLHGGQDTGLSGASGGEAFHRTVLRRSRHVFDSTGRLRSLRRLRLEAAPGLEAEFGYFNLAKALLVKST